MNAQTLNALLNLSAENEIVEFKEAKNSYDFSKLGKYFSAISNEANLCGKPYGWLVFWGAGQKACCCWQQLPAQEGRSR